LAAAYLGDRNAGQSQRQDRPCGDPDPLGFHVSS
jgi:hypothetical protein